MSARMAMALAAIASAGCTWGELPTAHLSAVAPATVVRGVKEILTLTGDGFGTEVVVDFDSSSYVPACGGLRVELRAPNARPVPAPVPLHDLWAVSSGELRARLDGDAGKATWDVVLIDGQGREATLGAALDVTTCGASNAACDDGDPCTWEATYGTPEDGLDQCTGNSSCGGTQTLADGTPCGFRCAGRGVVDGTCAAGACVPNPGLCEPPPTCAGT